MLPFSRELLLVLVALAGYPVAGHLAGHHYPATPTFGLPCPTTIFTLGMLLFSAAPAPRAVLAIPLLWAGVGSVAAFSLSMPEDLALLFAGLLALLFQLKDGGEEVEDRGASGPIPSSRFGQPRLGRGPRTPG